MSQDVYEWLFARGWHGVWLEKVPRWITREGDTGEGFDLYCHSSEDHTPPYRLASVRGPVEGVFEEILALERRYPKWCDKVKAEAGK